MKIEILKTGQKFAVALHIGCQGNIWLLICSLIENMQVRHKIIVDGQVKEGSRHFLGVGILIFL